MISHPSCSLRLAAALLATLVVGGVVLPITVQAATGTDLAFGYTWRDEADGATRDTVAFTAALVRISPAVNNAPPSGPLATGFPGGFPFYGTNYAQLWISDNGWISFTAPANAFPLPSAIPNAAGPGAMLAALWKDLTIVAPAGRMTYEYVVARGIFRVQWTGLDETAQPFNMDALLYPDGRIKFQYAAATAVGLASVGIENGAQNDGCQIAAAGVTAPGVGFTAGNVIEFLPPPILPPLCATFPAGGCRVINGSNPAGAGPNVLYYCLGTTQYAAREAVYSFTVAEPSTVQVDLTAATALTTFILTGCNERQCLRGPGTAHTLALWPGTYQVAVDGATAAEQGAFTLSIVCTPIGVPLNCGSTASGTTAGGPSRWATYPSCAGVTDLSGPESVYTLPVATATNLTVNLDFAGAALDVAVLRPGVGEITPADCVAWGDARAVAWNVQPGNHLVVVDGVAGASGAFTISTTCAVAADCTPPAGIIDFGTGRSQTVLGDTSSGTANIGTYACDPALAYDGRESIYEVVLPTAGQFAVYDPTGTSNHSWFILSDCNEGACIGAAGDPACAKSLPAGTYYLSVDSAAGDEGPFEMLLVFDESFNRWDVCEGPSGATLITDVSSPFWNFDDGAFCHTDPTSHNYPNGCTFAMYATVRCGTAMHLPFYDAEGGHIRIFDVLAGQYVSLTARSGGGWFQQGTDIDWSLMDCTGSDPRWNETVTDVFFERPAGLCGIYRLEFPNHSGFVWELYANCAGDRAPQFNIHDSLCAALEDYAPLPNVVLVAASVVNNCPNVTVTFVVQNNGCVAVTDFPLGLFDDTTLVATHLVPRIEAGETLMGSFMATYPVTPTGTVTLQADPLNTLVECTEAPGASCDAAGGLESIELPGCAAGCQVIAQGSATPARICGGDPTTISGAASGSALCPGGILEYQLSAPPPS